MVRTSRALLLLVLPLLSGIAGAEGRSTYRWVDDKGRVHYSDVPAAKGRSMQELQVKPGSGAARPVDQAAVAADQRMRECKQRTSQLAAYEASSTISETDGLGNTRDYSAQERARLLERTRAQVNEVCDR